MPKQLKQLKHLKLTIALILKQLGGQILDYLYFEKQYD